MDVDFIVYSNVASSLICVFVLFRPEPPQQPPTSSVPNNKGERGGKASGSSIMQASIMIGLLVLGALLMAIIMLMIRLLVPEKTYRYAAGTSHFGIEDNNYDELEWFVPIRYVGGVDSNSQFHGRGKLEARNGTSLDRTLKLWLPPTGRLIVSNIPITIGDVYSGDFAHGKYHGQGTYTFKSGN
jgi:hypothetical protein